MDIFTKLGIDWKLLIAQVINFGILFWILRRYAYQPMFDFLEKRTTRIEQGLKDAEAATVRLGEMEVKEKVVLTEARAEARNIIASAEESAKKRDTEREKETETKVKRLLEEAAIKIREEKDAIMTEAKQEIGELVIISVEKILREKVDVIKDKSLIEGMMK